MPIVGVPLCRMRFSLVRRIKGEAFKIVLPDRIGYAS